MKKYWKSTLVALMIIFGIGAFYLQISLASTGSTFKLETISGDPNEVKDIQFDVGYDLNGVYENDWMDSDGMKRREDYSYFERLDGLTGNPQYARLLEDYRQFMRGKDVWYKSLYEDANHLGYANVSYDFRSFSADNYSLDLAVLDKTSNESNEFTYKFEDQASINHVNVEGVEISKDELYVFTTVFTTENDEVRLYTFDLNSHDLISEGRIDDEENDVYFELLDSTDSITQLDHMVARKENYSQATGVPIGVELIVYDLATQETQSLDLPERLENTTQINIFDGQQLYFVETEEKGMTVIMFDVQEQEISNEIFVDIDTEQEMFFEEDLLYDDDLDGSESLSVMAMKNDRLYIGVPRAGDNELIHIHVVDTTTGDTVYVGEVAPEDPEDLSKATHMELFEIYVE